MYKSLLIRLPAPLLAGFIWLLSSQSTLPQLSKGPLSWDKLQHLLAFGILSAAIALWFSVDFWKRRPVIALLFTSFIGSLYGAIDELHQSFVPGRSSDVWDWAADTLGAVLGAIAVMLVIKKFSFEK